MNKPQVEVTAASLSRNLALWQDRAQREPVVITHHGRPRSVLLGIDEFRRRIGQGAVSPLTQLCDETGDAMVLLAKHAGEWTIVFANAAAAAMGRTTPDRAVGQVAQRLIGELGSAESLGRLDVVMHTGTPGEWRVQGGEPRRALLIRALRLEEGAGVVIADVTREALPPPPPLTEARRFLDRLLPASGLAYATLDVEGRFVFVSAAFSERCGLSRDRFLDGMRLADMLVMTRGDEVDEVLYQAAMQVAEVELAPPGGGETPGPPGGGGHLAATLLALPAEADRQPGYLLFVASAPV